MKKTIAAVAMIVSSQAALALPMPRNPNLPAPTYVKACLSVSNDRDGSKYGGCDASANNSASHVKLVSSGCTSDQIALRFLDKSPIEACMPAGVAQL